MACRRDRSVPDGYSLDNFYLARSVDDIQLDLLGDYKATSRSTDQLTARTHNALAGGGKERSLLLPPRGRGVQTRHSGCDNPFFDTGHFA
jgi:hypothetical protein